MGRKSRKEKIKSYRRSELLDVAASAFAKKGFEGTQVSEIAAEAEMSLATIYGLFPSKADLRDAVVEEVCLDFQQRIAELEIAAIESPLERFLAFIDFAVDYDLKESDPMKIGRRALLMKPASPGSAFGERSRAAGEESIRLSISLTSDFEKQLGMSGQGTIALIVWGSILYCISAVETELISLELRNLADDLKRFFRVLAEASSIRD